MKKNMIVGMAMAMGILTVGALSASAADTDFNMVACADKQAHQQFNHETAGLASALKAKEIELKDLVYTEGAYDYRKANELENEVNELKGKINTAAQKHGIPACSHS